MNVLLLTRYGHRGGSSRLRAYQFLPYLEQHGIHVRVEPLLSDQYLDDLYHGRRRRWGPILRSYARRARLLLRARRFDLVWTEYEVFPWLPALAERWLASRRIPYVVDYDDAIFHRYELHRRRGVRRLLGRKIDAVMRHATTVIAGNAYLGGRAQAAGARRVEYLPTVVDLAQYSVPPARQPSPFTIGWIGSPSTVRYLQLVQRELADFCRERQARLVVIGARPIELDGVPAEFRPWSPTTEARDIAAFDVGIMPLPDEPWERGKCGFKLIQYMACARPVIASPVGMNRDIVEHGINGFLAASGAEWRQALDALHRTQDLGARMGAAGRAKVEARYCTRVVAPELTRILTSATSRPEGAS